MALTSVSTPRYKTKALGTTPSIGPGHLPAIRQQCVNSLMGVQAIGAHLTHASMPTSALTAGAVIRFLHAEEEVGSRLTAGTDLVHQTLLPLEEVEPNDQSMNRTVGSDNHR